MSWLPWSKPPPPPPPESSMDFGKILMIYLLFVFFVNAIKKHGSTNIMNVYRSKKKSKDDDALNNVIGLNGVKEEIKYYMDFINNKKKIL